MNFQEYWDKELDKYKNMVCYQYPELMNQLYDAAYSAWQACNEERSRIANNWLDR